MLIFILVQLGLNVGSKEIIFNQASVAISTTDFHTLGIPIPKKSSCGELTNKRVNNIFDQAM